MSNALRLCFFCGSRPGKGEKHLEVARRAGRAAAESGIDVVYGGGSVGLMGALADAALDAGGHVLGVLPLGLFAKEVAHQRITALHSVDNMHERKAMMTTLSDGFVVLPGGHGTFDELFEAITWKYIGVHNKPIALVNSNGFFDGLLQFLTHVHDEGFLGEPADKTLIVRDSPEEAIAVMREVLAKT